MKFLPQSIQTILAAIILQERGSSNLSQMRPNRREFCPGWGHFSVSDSRVSVCNTGRYRQVLSGPGVQLGALAYSGLERQREHSKINQRAYIPNWDTIYHREGGGYPLCAPRPPPDTYQRYTGPMFN